MKLEKYSLSFTTGTLLHQESVNIAELFLKHNDWNAVKSEVLTQNILQARTHNTAKRVYSEICSRLKNLCDSELNLLVHGTTQEQGYLLWLAVCRRYKFIEDFATEIIHERYVSLNSSLQYSDFDSFFNSKSVWHSEMEAITSSTRSKLRQVAFKMLREAGLLTKDNTIIAAIFTGQFLEAISYSDKATIRLFPVFDTEVMRYLG
jgi:hypothetical protein